MRKSLKYMIITRLLLVTGVMLACFAALADVSLKNIAEANVSRYYNDSASEIFSKLNSTLANVYQMGQSLSVDEEVKEFLRVEEFERPAEEVRQMTNLIQSLQNITILQPYIHSFCIVNAEGKVYWSQSPYDSFFGEWFQEHALDNGDVLDAIGFVPCYEFPGTTELTDSMLLSSVTDVQELTGGKLMPIGKIIINLDLNFLVRDLLQNVKSIDQIGFWDEEHTFLYAGDKNGQTENFIPLDFTWNREGIQNCGSYYYSERILDNAAWYAVLRFPQISMGLFSNQTFLLMALGITLLGIALILILVFPLLNRISRQIKALEMAMHEFADGNMDVPLKLTGSVEMENISDGFHYMEVKSREYMEEALEHQKAKQQVAFELLLAKINPHFIYNTLNSVIYLARKKDHDAVIQLTSAFIYLLQDSIHLGTNSLYEKLETEFEVIDKYILIQRYRYMDRFLFRSEMDPDLAGTRIPKNILQPLIENAILHGICPVEDERECQVSLSAKRDGEYMWIEIADNGVGMEEAQIRRLLHPDIVDDEKAARSKIRPIGVNNILEKLRLVYREDHSLKINSEPGKGTVIRIRIPVR